MQLSRLLRWTQSDSELLAEVAHKVPWICAVSCDSGASIPKRPQSGKAKPASTGPRLGDLLARRARGSVQAANSLEEAIALNPGFKQARAL